MSESLCNLLDDYLDDELSKTDRLAFDQHLAVCEQCQMEVSLQRRLDNALSHFASTLAPANPLTPARNKHWTPKSSLLAACVALAAMTLIAWLASQAFTTRETHSEVAAIPKVAPQTEDVASDKAADPAANINVNHPRFRSIESKEYLAVIEPPADDELTVIMLYPKISESNDL